MDHEAMRQAYLRALNYKKTVFLFVCHTCKIDCSEDMGTLNDLVTEDIIYKVWQCSDCSSKNMEFV